ncbi:murein biosynthesis integral membrane protein MurJ [Asticcacaulis sp. YBE204]|uniref:murein biosynthesis integral membrane protein MurJ n=1 Tax=Asticcacaulis sp. YBE204 TaxID=1282363 RepID=UPI0003C3B43A|nr:murein biosynthesis integral membrane protein MurJ [Asticcacaulis sp. YBE204]ESQ80880.1 membrane protein [Asticcacaulis sp. YBE204]
MSDSSASPPLEPQSPKPQSVARSSLVFGGVTLISRVMGFARDLVITAAMGASGNIAADAYSTALQFPNLFRRIFAEGAFTAAFVPAYSATLEKDGPEAADRLARDAMATITLVAIVLSVIAQIFMPQIMAVFSEGYAENPEKMRLTVILTQITMPYLPCMTMVALLSGVLNARGRFALSALAPTLLNLFMLIFVWFAKDPVTAAFAASWAVIAAGLAQAALLVWGCRKTGAKIGLARPSLTPEIRNLLILAVPGAMAAAATQINVFVSSWLASAIDGARTWLNVADRLYQLPLGLVGVAIGVALLPALSRSVQAGDHERSQTVMDEAVLLSMALTLPAAAAIIAMPFFLIDGLYTRGEFLTHDARETASALLHYGWGVPAFVLARVLTPAFFARKDTFGPMKFAVVSVIVNLACGLTLFPLIGVAGLAIGTSAAAWVNVFLMLFTLAHRKTWVLGAKPAIGLIKVLIAGGLMGAFCAACSYYRPLIEGPIAQVMPHGTKEIAIVAVCFAGLLLYIALLFVTRAIRPSDIKKALRTK